jgi:hypothetical protein
MFQHVTCALGNLPVRRLCGWYECFYKAHFSWTILYNHRINRGGGIKLPLLEFPTHELPAAIESYRFGKATTTFVALDLLPNVKLSNATFRKILGLGYWTSFSWFEILGLEPFVLLQIDTLTKSYSDNRECKGLLYN